MNTTAQNKKSKGLDDNNPTKNNRKDPKIIAGLVRKGRDMIPHLSDSVYADLAESRTR